MRAVVLAIVVGCTITTGSAVRTGAEEFRVETDVFFQEDKQPCVETLTVFTEGIVYDFLLCHTKEVTMFDRGRGRIVLMDPDRKVKTELTTEGILAFVAQMKAQLNPAQRSYLRGNGLELETDEEGWITLSNQRVVYRALGKEPKEPKAVSEFQQFADWYARLNAMRLGNVPPFARLRLNAVLADKGLIPTTVERTLIRKRGLSEDKTTLRSQHLVNWRLSQTDVKMIDRASTYMATFRNVTLGDYLQLADLPDDSAIVKR